MSLDPLIAFTLMLMLWGAGIAYILRMAALEQKRRLQRRGAKR
jgi:hypothetical protein